MSESSVATAPLVVVVQGNHEHRNVVIGHLPFLCRTVILPLRAVYQHLSQLREPVWVLSVAREEAPHQPCHLLIGQDIPEPISCHDNHVLLLWLQLVHIQHSHLWDREQEGLELNVCVQDSELMVS